ncbi:MAG: hypothetical protein IJN38_03650 [Clostridia bacterium]|nr:hypothetical protein [Clostridia bacterium]
MNYKTKKILSVIMCVLMFATAACVNCYAVTSASENAWVKVDAPFANMRKDMKPGQKTHVSIDWHVEPGVDYQLKYYANGECCEVEFIPDNKGGVSGADVTVVSYGSCFIGFQVLSPDGRIMAIDTLEIRALEPKPLLERIELFFTGIGASFSMLGIAFTFLSAGILSAIFPNMGKFIDKIYLFFAGK